MQFQGATVVALALRLSVLTLLAVVAMGASAHAGTVAADVVGQWRFDEPGGQFALDDAAYGLHGVLGTSANADAADPARVGGLSGAALHFSGSTFVRLPDAPALAAPTLTVEAVVRADASPGSYRYVLSRGSRACFSGTYGLYTAQAGGIAFYVFDGERFFVSATAKVDDVWNGAWHRVTGVFDGSTVRVFLDGRQVGEALHTPPDTAIGYDQPDEDTYFGTYVGTCTLPFVGDLDSMRIWAVGLTPRAVAAQSGIAQAVGSSVPAPRPATAAPTIIAPPTLPRSSCRVSVSRKTITARSRSVVTARAVGAGRPLNRARVTVKRAGHSQVVTSRHTNAGGRAKLVLKVRRVGRLRVSIAGRASCSPAYIRVTRANA